MSGLGILGGMLGGDVGIGSAGETSERCSRAGCSGRADWAILWRNPKIHTGERKKTWLACNDHRAFLEDFLRARDFPLTVVAAQTLSQPVPWAPKEQDE